MLQVCVAAYLRTKSAAAASHDAAAASQATDLFPPMCRLHGSLNPFAVFISDGVQHPLTAGHNSDRFITLQLQLADLSVRQEAGTEQEEAAGPGPDTSCHL